MFIEIYPISNLKMNCIYKNQFLGENLNIVGFFFEILQKFIEFINSDYCIGKIASKYIKLHPVFIKKKISN